MNMMPFCAMLLAIGVAVGLTQKTPAQSPPAPPAQNPPAESAPASVVVIATIDAFWSADEYAKTAGYVSEVKHDLGDHVKKGDLLAVLYVPELDKSLAQAKAQRAAKEQMKKAADAAVAQAQQLLIVARSQCAAYNADFQLAQITLKRQEELSAGKAATAQQLDEARAKSQIAQATVDMGEAKVGSAQADIQAAQANRDVAAAQVDVADAQIQEIQALLEYTQIVAPFDGVITRREVNPGDLVQAATASRTAPLFTVRQFDTVRVFCDVPEAQAAGVSVGAQAEVKLHGLGGQVIPGTVTRVSDSLDPATRTMRVEIDLPNPTGALRPGMYAQVTIRLQPIAAVPKAVTQK